VRRDVDLALPYRGDQNLHGAEGACDDAGFTADTLLLIDLHAVANPTDGAVGTATGAGGGFAVVTGHRPTLPLMLDDGNARMKLRAAQNMLVIVMRHHAGDFTSTTSYTLLAIRHNKTIHGNLLLCSDKPSATLFTDPGQHKQCPYAQDGYLSDLFLCQINLFPLSHRAA